MLVCGGAGKKWELLDYDSRFELDMMMSRIDRRRQPFSSPRLIASRNGRRKGAKEAKRSAFVVTMKWLTHLLAAVALSIINTSDGRTVYNVQCPCLPLSTSTPPCLLHVHSSVHLIDSLLPLPQQESIVALLVRVRVWLTLFRSYYGLSETM